ncbi:hypothetical protein BH20ACT5_BH20ACT5_14090 [soil metagenome]
MTGNERRPGVGAGAAEEIAGGALSGSTVEGRTDRSRDAAPAGSYGSTTIKRRRRSCVELEVVDAAIVEAVRDEHPVTLRGVYYRVVSAGAVEKTEAGYRLVGRQLLKLRRDGSVPYEWITDGTRWITKPDSYTGIDQMLNDAAASYRRALWHNQPVEVHIFTEKDAISGVLLPVTEQWDVPLGVLRGYSSESFAHSVAAAIKSCGKREIFVYQLGDHDPSGLDAWRAFRVSVAGFLGEKVTAQMAARAAGFGVRLTAGQSLGVAEVDPYDDDATAYEFVGGPGFPTGDLRTVTFARIAVTPDQIELYDLPTRPTKRTDTRARGFAGASVEVDAIPAPMLRSILTAAIERHVDPEALRLTEIAEDSERAILYRIAGVA